MTEPEESLKRLRAIRSGNRGVVTKYTKEATELLNVGGESSKDRLCTIANLLGEKISRLKQLDDQVVQLCDVVDIEDEIEETEEIFSRISDVSREIAKFTKTTDTTTKEKKTTDATTKETKTTSDESKYVESVSEEAHLSALPVGLNISEESSSTSLTTSPSKKNTQPSARSKLPKLVLQKFRGDITNYRAFWENFQSAIHNNDELATIDKFNYLYSLLEGPALLAIKGLALTKENYQASIDILKQRFGNPQLVISAHMDELLKLPACTGDKSTQLRIVYDKVSINVRGLEALGINSNQYGSLLIPVIMSKLPSEIRIQIARKTASEVWEIRDLLEVIRKEVEAREISEKVRVNNEDSSDHRKQNDHWKYAKPRNPSSASSLFVKSGNNGETKLKCVYCGEFHFSASCGRVKDIDARRDILRQSKRCYLCLRVGHRINECDKSRNCRRCEGKHHQSICLRDFPSTNKTIQTSEEKPNRNSTDDNSTTVNQNLTTISTTTTRRQSKVLLQTATTFAYSKDSTRAIPVRVLLDSGSQRSYVTDHVKERLDLPSNKKEILNLNTFGETRFTKKRCDVVKLNLQTSQGKDIEISALCFQKICSPIYAKICLDKYPHLKELNLADSSLTENDQDDIDILIGSDYYFDIIIGEIIRGESGPVAVSSKLGWILSGPSNEAEIHDRISMSNLVIEREEPTSSPCFVNQDDSLSNDLQRFWDTESIGIIEQITTKPTEFLEDIHFDEHEGRYEVGLPWKKDCLPQSTGYTLCVKRLRQLQSRLKKDSHLMEEYHNIIQQQIESGIIEAVKDEDDDGEGSYYLPHHGVVRKGKQTTKLRVVFDGSAKPDVQSPSINECLEKGPNLVPYIFDTIVKFRSYPIGIVSDIEKAFHQIQINPLDRRMLRFLWFDNIEGGDPQIKRFQFRRLVFGLTPSPAILATVIQHHLSQHKEKEPGTVSLLSDSLYVDDLAGGAHNDRQAMEIYNKSRQLMKDGGFMLRKWNSNSKELRCQIAADNLANDNSASQEIQELSTQDVCATREIPSANKTGEDKSVQILGLNWDIESDKFHFNTTELIDYVKSLLPTKRSVLKISAKIFDPIGMLTPFTINLKHLFQILCSDHADWDAPLDGKLLSSWNCLVHDLEAIGTVRVQRCYFSRFGMTITNQQIHGFCDASEKAYAAVVYLRTEYEDSHVETTIISSKTRVAPLKKQSIPRLELLGATILARLVTSICKVLWSLLTKPEVFMWTDSFTALCWIKNDKGWKQYIQRRVNEIRELTNKDHWKFCPGEVNPADLPSRGCTGSTLAEKKEWFDGPEFLAHSKEHWPKPPQHTSEDNEIAFTEIVKRPPMTTHSLATLMREECKIGNVIDCHRYSTMTKLLRVTATVLRFVKKLRRRETAMTSSLTAGDLMEAEVLWIKDAQSTAFPQEIQLMAEGQTRSNQLINQLGLFLDEKGTIRCEGRLENSMVPLEAKKPILLPSKHHLTELIIQQKHVTVQHNGIKQTLNCIRERYWVLRGREAVKRVIRKCVTCKKLEGKPFPTPKVPNLPSCRVSDDPPFTNTGLDFAGPLLVREKEATDNANPILKKVYVSLFTCASTRAIHLELQMDLSTSTFLQAFRRFSSRRGIPRKLISDNAKTFKAAAKELSKLTRSNEVHRYFANKGVIWDFIVEKAPWHGGFWERLVKGIKRCLKKSIGRACLSFEELRTILVEVECTLNNRPLTYVYDDEQGISYPLTPATLIYGRRTTMTPNDNHFEIVSTNKSLTRRAKYQKKILNEFTNQWRKEYLLSLRESANPKTRGNVEDLISVGDIVILKNESTARIFWKLAKVEELIRSKDNIVRSAKIRVLNNLKRHPVLLRRPIQHLIPLEVRSEPETKKDEEQPVAIEEQSEVGRTRPRRHAAVAGELSRKQLQI